nr:hypothetical protein CIT39_15780 [Bradyrhizobium symbiodeficiens]
MGEQDQSSVRCKQCCNDIPQGALLCSDCGSYQDWRGWFSVSSTVLALLTALLSVLGIVAPVIINALHSPRSDAFLQTPSIDGTTLRVLAVNRGDASASFVYARIDGDYLAGATKVRLRSDADAIISPGSKLLTFDIIPLLDETQSYDGSLEAMTAAVSGKPLPTTSVLLGLAQSDGGVSVLKYTLTNDEIFRLLRDNADRCSSIDKPNFTNGCIGNGAPTKGQASNRPSTKPAAR